MPKRPRDIEDDIRRALKLKKPRKHEQPDPTPPPPKPIDIVSFEANPEEKTMIDDLIIRGEFNEKTKPGVRHGLKCLLLAREHVGEAIRNTIGT